jgi:predicted RNA-binding Zn ribbon-like protein
MTHQHQVAPGDLETVRAFINTRDIEGATDALTTPALLSEWLVEHGLARDEPAVSDDDLQDAHRLREALRGLAWANNGDPFHPEHLTTLNETAERARLTLRFRAGDDVELLPGAGGIIGALGRIISIAADAMKDGTWSRLKACRNEECGWAFYDHARNRSAKWCTMAVCGNRMKARAFRARRAEESGA